jgi:hypothetical protein
VEKDEYKNKDSKAFPMPVHMIRREGMKNGEKSQRNMSLWLG